MTIRPATTDDDAVIGRIYGECYGTGVPFTRQIAAARDSQTYCIDDARGIQATYRILSQNTYWDGGLIRTGGIAGVAVMPAARRAGYAAAMMRHSLVTMREMGMSVSTLFPFSFNYYRKFGWEWVGTRMTQTADFSLLKPFSACSGLRAISTADRHVLEPIQTEYARGFRGCIERNDLWWERALGSSDERPLLVYVHEGERPDGYMTFTLDDGDVMRLREWVALNPAAYRMMLGFVGVHYMRYTRFRIVSSVADPLRTMLYDHGFDVTIDPTIQARVVDLPGALAALRPAGSGRFTLAIEDADAEWNRGPWAVEFSDGAIEVRRTTTDAAVRLDIQALTQAFYGDPAAHVLRRGGRIAVSDENDYYAFQSLLKPATVFTMDHF